MSYRFLFILILASLLMVYTMFRVGHFTGRWKWIARIGVATIFLIALGSQFAFRTGKFDPESTTGHFIPWVGGVALGLWATFMLLTVLVDLAVLLGWGAERLISPERFRKGLERRAFLRKAVPASLAGASAAFTGIGLGQAIAGPKVKEVQVPITGLPPELDGLKIAQISDLHVGATISKSYVENVVMTVQSLGASLIAVTGDLADGDPVGLRERIAPLKDLKAELGVFYVTGNHEYYWGARAWITAMENHGMIPLVNENRVVSHSGKKILVAGVTDTSGGNFVDGHDCQPGKAGLSPHSDISLRLLLSHRPDACFLAEAQPYHLQLSGHTHAGQFFPWSLLMPLAHKYYKGLNRHRDSWVYVNQGTGYWGAPHRFTIPAEITLLRLSRA